MKMSLTVLAACLLLTGCAAGPEYGRGVRSGSLQKFSQKGFICKSYEGEMVMGGFNTKATLPNKGLAATSNLTNVWDFSVTDKAVAAKIEAAMNSGADVTLHYSEKWYAGYCTTDTKYIVDNVIVKEAAQ